MAVTRSRDFDSWYRQEYARVLAAVTVVSLGEPSRAADATDEAFVRALEKWDEVSTMETPTGWVIRVAANIARRSHWRGARVRELLKTQPTAEGELDSYPDVDLWREMERLTPRQRLALALRYVEDLPQSTVANELGVARGTAAATLHQARGRLRSRISQPQEEQE